MLNIYRWIFVRPALYQFHKLVFQLSLRGLGVLNYENRAVSGEKYFINKVLPNIAISDTPLFMDVGANIGEYTKALLVTCPEAQIHAFEPHPSSFMTLKNNNFPANVKLHNLALGKNKRVSTLYDRVDVESGSSHASLHKSVISEIHKQDTTEFSVTIDTLDELCSRLGIVEIDFIKIDTEGNELAVLLGARKLIENQSIRCIHFEFNEMNIVSRAFFRDFRRTLDGYELYRLLPQGMILLDSSPIATELFAYQNIIAVSKSMNIKH